MTTTDSALENTFDEINKRHNLALQRLEEARQKEIERAKERIETEAKRKKAIEGAKALFEEMALESGFATHELARLFVREYPAPGREPRKTRQPADAGNSPEGKERGKRTTITAEIREKVKTLAESGKKAPTIAKELGISNPTVYNILRDEAPNLTPEATGTSKKKAASPAHDATEAAPAANPNATTTEDPSFD